MLYAGYPWQTGSLRSKFNKLLPLMPTQPAQQLLYLRIFGRSKPEGGGGGGWSAPSVASRLPSQAWHQTSDVSMSSDIRVSDIGHASDLGYQTSDIAYWISDIRFRTYEIRHRTSAIGQRTSDIGVWASDVKYQAWDVFLSQSFVFSASWFKMSPSLCFGSIFKSFWTAITHVRNNLSQIIV